MLAEWFAGICAWWRQEPARGARHAPWLPGEYAYIQVIDTEGSRRRLAKHRVCMLRSTPWFQGALRRGRWRDRRAARARRIRRSLPGGLPA